MSVSERLDAIEARKNSAVREPWQLVGGGEWISPIGIGIAPDDGGVSVPEGEFIAHAPQDITYLLDLARKQQAAIQELSQWAGRSKAGYYDEAQDDVVQIIRPALEAKP